MQTRKSEKIMVLNVNHVSVSDDYSTTSETETSTSALPQLFIHTTEPFHEQFCLVQPWTLQRRQLQRSIVGVDSKSGRSPPDYNGARNRRSEDV